MNHTSTSTPSSSTATATATTTTPPPPPQSVKGQKTVHWDVKARCRKVGSLKECEPEIVQDIWYSREEQQIMNDRIDQMVDQIKLQE